MLHETLGDTHPGLSLSTIYSTLESFVQAGLIRRIGRGGARLRVDGTSQDHDHAICRVCHQISDVDRAVTERPLPPANLPDGLQVMGVHVEYDVICSRCDV